MNVGFASRADADRIARAARMIEKGAPANKYQSTPLGLTIRPGALHSDPIYRVGVVTWYNAATDDYTDGTDEVLIRTHENPVPPAADVPVFAIFAGLLEVSATEQKAVYMVSTSASASGDTGRWLTIDDESADVVATPVSGSIYRALLLDSDGDGTWTVGDEVRVTFVPDSGSVFLNGRSYWATLNGTSGEYDLYHSLGSDEWIFPVCRDGETQCDKAIIPAPFAVIENVDCETGEPL